MSWGLLGIDDAFVDLDEVIAVRRNPDAPYALTTVHLRGGSTVVVFGSMHDVMARITKLQEEEQ